MACFLLLSQLTVKLDEEGDEERLTREERDEVRFASLAVVCGLISL